MMGVGYTGSSFMPQYETREKFAWRPILTTSGKWIWWRKYVKFMKIYWGPAGELPVIDAEFYTEGEWLLEQIKNNYPTNKRPAPPAFFKSSRKSKGP
jgi:hypothetical protein